MDLLPQATGYDFDPVDCKTLCLCSHTLTTIWTLVKYDCRGEIKTQEIFQMKKSAENITCGNFKALRKIIALTRIKGEWVEIKRSEGHYQYRTADGAVMNYWPKTGTILFQGSEFAADKLKAAVLKRAVVIKHEQPLTASGDRSVSDPVFRFLASSE